MDDAWRGRRASVVLESAARAARRGVEAWSTVPRLWVVRGCVSTTPRLDPLGKRNRAGHPRCAGRCLRRRPRLYRLREPARDRDPIQRHRRSSRAPGLAGCARRRDPRERHQELPGACPRGGGSGWRRWPPCSAPGAALFHRRCAAPGLGRARLAIRWPPTGRARTSPVAFLKVQRRLRRSQRCAGDGCASVRAPDRPRSQGRRGDRDLGHRPARLFAPRSSWKSG